MGKSFWAHTLGLRSLVVTAGVIALGSANVVAHAQVTLAHLASFTSSISARVSENHAGAEVYIKKINASGGVNGQQIELRKVDDNGDATKAAALATELTKDPKVVAVFMPGLSTATDNIAKVLDPLSFPVIAPSAGPAIISNPVRRSVFNLRAAYQVESENLIVFLNQLGYSRFAIAYTDDAFGKDVIVGATKGFARLNLKPITQVGFPRDKPDLKAVVEKLLTTDFDVLLAFAPGPNAAEVFKGVRGKNRKAVLASVSNNSSAAFIKMLGENAHGTFVSQVVPSERSALAVVTEMASVFPGGREKMSPSHIEGYLAAKLAVEAIRRAGKNPTAAKVHAALEDGKDFDLGGLKVNFSSTEHIGLTFTELSMISAKGTFLR
jgi:branched-chain amino acid transport system substrate-binding protein